MRLPLLKNIMVIILLWHYPILLLTHGQWKDEKFGAPWTRCLFAAIAQWEFLCISHILKRTQVQALGIQFFIICHQDTKAFAALTSATASLLLTAALKTLGFYQHMEAWVQPRAIPSKKEQLLVQESVTCWSITHWPNQPFSPLCFKAEAKDKVHTEITMPNFHCFHGGVCTDKMPKILFLSTLNWWIE